MPGQTRPYKDEFALQPHAYKGAVALLRNMMLVLHCSSCCCSLPLFAGHVCVFVAALVLVLVVVLVVVVVVAVVVVVLMIVVVLVVLVVVVLDVVVTAPVSFVSEEYLYSDGIISSFAEYPR